MHSRTLLDGTRPEAVEDTVRQGIIAFVLGMPTQSGMFGEYLALFDFGSCLPNSSIGASRVGYARSNETTSRVRPSIREGAGHGDPAADQSSLFCLASGLPECDARQRAHPAFWPRRSVPMRVRGRGRRASPPLGGIAARAEISDRRYKQISAS